MKKFKGLPTSEGWYAWWESSDSKAPYYTIAKVIDDNGVLMINFEYDTGIFKYIPLDDNIVERYWLKLEV